MWLDGHFHGYFGVRLVANNLKVIQREAVNVFHLPFDDELGEWPGLPLQLWECEKRVGCEGRVW